MFQGGAEDASLQHKLFRLNGVAVVNAGNRKQRDVEHDATGFYGFGQAEEVADFRFITESAGAQLVMAAGFQAHEVVKPDQLRAVINYLLFLCQSRSVNIFIKQLLSFKNNRFLFS